MSNNTAQTAHKNNHVEKLPGLTQLEKDILFATTQEVVAKHHITKDAVYSRKYAIQARLKKHKVPLEKAKDLPTLPPAVHGNMGKPNVNAGKTLPKAVPVDDFLSLFRVDDTPPPLPIGADEQKKKAEERIKQLASDLAVNGAMIIPKKYRALATTLLNTEFGGMKWKVYPIKDNPEAVRIYKLEYKT